MTNRFNNGLETQGAVKQMQALQANAEAELLAVDESIQLQKNAIAALLGKGLTADCRSNVHRFS